METKIAAAEIAAARLGIFRTKDLVEAGFPREYLRRLTQKGKVSQVGRGVYVSESVNGDQHQSLLEATTRFPKGVVCLMSALQFYEIGTQAPFQVWLAFPSSTRLPKNSEKLPTRFCKFSSISYSFGIKEYNVQGGTIRVYTPAKTVADCFKYRRKFGLDVAVEALRDGWKAKLFTLAELKESAVVCRVSKIIQPYLEMLK